MMLQQSLKLLFIAFGCFFFTLSLSAQEAWPAKSGGTFYGVGSPPAQNLKALIVASYDGGVTWEEIYTNRKDQTDLHGLDYDGKNTLVAVGKIIMTSIDKGKTWQEVPIPEKAQGSLKDVAYGDGLWVAVGGSETILISTDGLQWERFSTSSVPTIGDKAKAKLQNKIHGKLSKTIGGRKAGKVTGGTTSAKSEDLIYGMDSKNHFNAVAWDGQSFMATGSYERCIFMPVEGGAMSIGEDVRHEDIGMKTFDIAHYDGHYFMVGYRNYHSTDGKDFSQQKILNGYGNTVIKSHGKYIIAGGFGLLVHSEDGETWTRGQGTPTNSKGEFYALAQGKNRVVALGNDGIHYLSDDGVNWKQMSKISVSNRDVRACIYVE